MQICSSCFHTKRQTQGPKKITNFRRKSKGETLTTFYCCGRVPPEGLYRKRHGMCEQEESEIELAIEVFKNENLGVTQITNPEVPFVDDLPEELYQGRAIEVHGKLLENANRFSINLSAGNNNSDSDIALHFNPRIDRHIIVRNHRIKNKWGVEETTSLQEFPFKRGRNFSVLIFVADEQFLVALNKIHYCAFAFRISIDKIKSLIILGDVTLSLVQHSDKTVYPPLIFKKTPTIIVPQPAKSKTHKCYFRRKSNKITAESKVEIFGRLKILPRAFYINLQQGISVWPHPIIPFHMNYRLHLPGTNKNEKEIILNSWLDGYWGIEEVVPLCPFLPGADFQVKIVCKDSAYNIYVNDEYLYNYTKRSNVDVDAVVVHGDVVIHKVIVR